MQYPTIHPVDASYAAGYLDGEGYFSVRDPRVEIKVDSIHPAPLIFLRDLFGGHLRLYTSNNPGRRPYWRWRVFGKDAANVAEVIGPHLRLKVAEANAIALFPHYPKGSETRAALQRRAQAHRDAEHVVV
jgi:hypothetical protein